MTELRTIRPKEKSAIPVTEPPNHSTSPYAIRMIVRFLNIVYTGIERNWRALVLVYMVPMSNNETGNPASYQSNSADAESE